jgi:hypothetical protein
VKNYPEGGWAAIVNFAILWKKHISINIRSIPTVITGMGMAI